MWWGLLPTLLNILVILLPNHCRNFVRSHLHRAWCNTTSASRKRLQICRNKLCKVREEPNSFGFNRTATAFMKLMMVAHNHVTLSKQEARPLVQKTPRNFATAGRGKHINKYVRPSTSIFQEWRFFYNFASRYGELFAVRQH